MVIPEGKKLFLDISDILNKRYSTGSTTIDTEKIIVEIYEKNFIPRSSFGCPS